MFLISRHWYAHLQYLKKFRRYVRKSPINDCRMHWIDNSCYQKLVYIDFDFRSLKMFLYTLNLFVFFNAIFKVYNVNLTIRKRIIIALWEETRVKHLMSDVTTHIKNFMFVKLWTKPTHFEFFFQKRRYTCNWY